MVCGLLTNNLTGSDMKTSANTVTAVVLGTMAVFGFSSCIFDGAGDKFYRTLWESSEVPLGPFEVEQLTLEFLCGESISIKVDDADMTLYGTYETDGETAVFHNLSLEIENFTITFIDANWGGETLFLRWRIENSVYPFTTAMHRLSSYN